MTNCIFCKHQLNGEDRMRILPSMAVFACLNCYRETTLKAVTEKDITNGKNAPWSQSELDSLRRYQLSTAYFPFVCLNDHTFEVTREGLRCEQCKLEQPWAYNWTLDWSWFELLPPSNQHGAPVPKRPKAPQNDREVALPLPSDETSISKGDSDDVP